MQSGNIQQPTANNPKPQEEPLVPDFQSAMSEVPPIPQTVAPINENADTATTQVSSGTSDLPPVITPTPKKKFGSGRIIATILGILLLVGGIGAGIYLTQQRQLFQQQARVCVDANCSLTMDPKSGQYQYDYTKDVPDANGNMETIDGKKVKDFYNDVTGKNDNSTTTTLNLQSDVNNCGQAGHACDSGEICGGGTCIDLSTDPNNCGQQGHSCESGGCAGGVCTVPSNSTCGRNNDLGAPVCCANTKSCSGTIVCEKGVGGAGRKECQSSSGSHCTMEADSADCTGANPPETTTSSPTASCQNIKAYSTSWVLLSSSELAALTTGDKVNFCVLGSASEGVFDMARFTINGVQQATTTVKRPGTNDFCQDYTIPAAVTTFNVSAQVHHETLGWK